MKAGRALRDERLVRACEQIRERDPRAWLQTQLEHRAAHTLVVPS